MKKASLILLVTTLVLAAFTAGFFFGKNFSGTKLIIAGQGEIPATTAPATPSTVPSAPSGPEDVFIPSVTEPAPSNPSGLLNINTATHEELCELPGIGEVLAQSIIDYRTQNGPFQSIYELTDVPGIGDKRLAAIENMITTGG